MLKKILFPALAIAVVLLALRSSRHLRWNLSRSVVHTSLLSAWSDPHEETQLPDSFVIHVSEEPLEGESARAPFGEVIRTPGQWQLEVPITQFEVTGSLWVPLRKRVKFKGRAEFGNTTHETLEDGGELFVRNVDGEWPLSGEWILEGEATFHGSIAGWQVREELLESFRESIANELTEKLQGGSGVIAVR